MQSTKQGGSIQLKNDLKKIIDHYDDKGHAIFYKIENKADTGTKLTYSGIINGGLSVFFIAVEIDKPLNPKSLDALKDHIASIGEYDRLNGHSFVLFYNKLENECYKLVTDQLKIYWRAREGFSQKSVTRVKKTVYGPDFLNKIMYPFKIARDENDPLSVFS